MGRNFHFRKTLSKRLYDSQRAPLIPPWHLAWRGEDVERRHVNRGLVEQSWLAMWPVFLWDASCFFSCPPPSPAPSPLNTLNWPKQLLWTVLSSQGYCFTQRCTDVKNGSQGKALWELLLSLLTHEKLSFSWTRRSFSKRRKHKLILHRRAAWIGVWVKWFSAVWE